MDSRVIRFYDPDGEYGYLSNWYISDFTYAGRKYHSMEQYMMFQKALTFGDLEIADKIMASKDLPEIKKLGRSVAHYNDVLWKTIRVQIMRRGIRAKFQQNPELLYNLLGTGSSLMAECAPRDLVWGIGLDIEDARSGDPKEWKGRNLLGRTLMRVREDLRAWCSVAGSSVTQYVDAVDLRTPQPVRVSRRQDSGKADRIRRELEAAAGGLTTDPSSENEGLFGETAETAGKPDGGEEAVIREEDYNTRDRFGMEEREGASEVSVWNMHIYEACMLPYLSEIVSTWMEEVFFNLRRSRSYEDLGVANYTFEELEWMFRSGQSAGLPIAGFFEMKQDIFDLMRYRGGLRNPASLLAQVESMTDGFHETLPSTEAEPAADEQAGKEAASEQYEETHIIVDVARRDNRNRLVGTQDPGRTSSPDTYLGVSSTTGTGDVQTYVPEEGEEATTTFGSGIAEGVRAGNLWSAIRNMEDETQENTEKAGTVTGESEGAGDTAAAEAETAAEEPVTVEVPFVEIVNTADISADETFKSVESYDEDAGADEEPAENAAAAAEPYAEYVSAAETAGETITVAETFVDLAAKETVAEAGTTFTVAEPVAEQAENQAETIETADSTLFAEAKPEAAAAAAEAAETVAAEETAKAVEAVTETVREAAKDVAPAAEETVKETAKEEPKPAEKPWYAEFVKPAAPKAPVEEPAAEEITDKKTETAAETKTAESAKAAGRTGITPEAAETAKIVGSAPEAAETAETASSAPEAAETAETAGSATEAAETAKTAGSATEAAETAETEPKAARKPVEAEDYDGDGEPDEDYDFADESDEEESEEEEIEEEDDFPEPPAPKTQFIPRAEPAPQRPLTYRDEIRSEIVIRHGNIAAVDCDCVVNATNTTLMGGNGLDNSIMKAAGPELLRECAALKGCDVGRAKISGGYRLKAQFVIHTVGPRYSGDETDPVYLTMCYENCLNLAMKYDIHSIAFPPISTGYYGYPLREATLVASRTVQGWMRRHPEYGIKVIFVSADDRTFAMYKDVFK